MCCLSLLWEPLLSYTVSVLHIILSRLIANDIFAVHKLYIKR